MPITATELKEYGSANRPTDDVTTTGGAIATTARPLDTQIVGATENLEFLSSNAGDTTQTLTILYRDASGVEQTFGPTSLNGTTPVTGPTGVQRITNMTLSATTTGNVTVRVVAGADRHVFAAGETGAFIMFRNSSSSGTQQVFYEKTFWKNTNGSLALTSAQVTLTSDPSSKFEIGLDATKDASTSAANRKTAPGGISFVDDSVAQNVPTGSLGAGEAIGVWRKMTLAIDAVADEPASSTQLSGQTV